METPGRYIVGELTDVSKGRLKLDTAAHVTCIDAKWSFQHISLMQSFTAELKAYAGFGPATEECAAHYRVWKEYITNPPNFEVEDSE
jgi:hypothetical protein